MPTVATILLTALGAVLILAALRDVFDALFHPGGPATLSRGVMRATWWVFHRIAGRWPEARSLAGPVALIVVIAGWATLLAVGWALIFWPHIDSAYHFVPPESHEGAKGFVDSLYISLVTLGTVGFGDVTPTAAWLRIITPLEALIGFGLLTASIAWLMAIYPVLTRRRSLAYEISLLRQAEEETGSAIRELEPAASEGLYSELISRLITVERDLVSFPIAYYFAETDDRFSLPEVMPYLLELAEVGTEEDVEPRVRLRAAMLRDAIGDFAATAAARFHGRPGESISEALEEYARDHGR